MSFRKFQRSFRKVQGYSVTFAGVARSFREFPGVFKAISGYFRVFLGVPMEFQGVPRVSRSFRKVQGYSGTFA